MLKRVWGESCKSWYKRTDGRILTLFPHDARTWAKETAAMDWDDFQTGFKRAAIG